MHNAPVYRRRKLRVAIVKPPWANLKSSFLLLAKVYSSISKKYNMEFTIFHDTSLKFKFENLKTKKLWSPDKLTHLYKPLIVLGLPYYYYPGLIKKLKGYDIISTGSPELFIYAIQCYYAAKKYGAKLFLNQSQTHYGYLFPYTKFVALHFTKKFVKKASCLFFTNKKSEDAYIKFGLIKNGSKKSIVTGHAIDTDQFRPMKVKKHKNKFVVLGVGALHKIKGFDILIRAIVRLIKKGHNDIELWFVGEGKDKIYFKNLTKKLNIQNHVKFLGYQKHSELIITYNKSDLYVLCNRQEITPTVSEALLCSLPAISVECGGVHDILTNNETGIIVPKNNFLGLVNAIETLKNNKKLRSKLAKKGRAHIKNNFGYKKVAEKIYGAYMNK